MYLSYREAIARLPRNKQRSTDQRLAELTRDGARYQNLVAATQSETRVDETLWDEFFDVVFTARGQQLALAIRKWAQLNVVMGQPSQWLQPLVRATSRAALVRALEKQRTSSGLAVTNSMAESLVDDLTNAAKWQFGVERARALGLNLAYYTVWATFSTGPEPYANLPTTANEIACDLGFDDGAGRGVAYSGDLPLIVLEYIPDAVETKFPTMVEAWASPMPNYYYLPAPAGSPWGMTRTWPNGPPTAKSRPEVVHKPSPLCDLISVAVERY